MQCPRNSIRWCRPVDHRVAVEVRSGADDDAWLLLARPVDHEHATLVHADVIAQPDIPRIAGC